MATVNLNRDSYLVDDGLDGKVIVADLADVPGGRALDMSGWDEDVLKAGHIIVHNTSTGVCKPLGLTGDNYADLGANEEYYGVLKCSILKAKPAAAILTVGEVNADCCPYPVTATIKAGLPAIRFI